MGKPHDRCPLCGGTSSTPHPHYVKHHLLRCAACGFHYSGIEPGHEELLAFYSNYPMPERLSPVTAARYDELLAALEPFRKNGRLLDMGCGAGMFLDRARAAGWEVYGTEYPDKVVARCREKGIVMHQGSVTEHPWPAGHFDVAVTFEVIEHDLRAMTALLRPGGALYVTTPNFNSVSRWILGGRWNVVWYPEHLSYFTPRVMHRTLVSLGMERLTIHTTGVSLHRINRSTGKPSTVNGLDADEDLRRRIEVKWHLRAAKATVNAALNLFKRGDTIKALYRKRT